MAKPMTTLVVRVSGRMLERLNRETHRRRKAHDGWYDQPTRSLIVREMIGRELDRLDRERANQRKLEL